MRHTATLLDNGRVLIMGVGGDAELYDPATGTFSRSRATMDAFGWGQSATLLGDGRVLLAGGWHNDHLLASAAVYDPSTDTSSLTGSMTTARSRHTATLLPDGRVLVAGGGDETLCDSNGTCYSAGLSSAEVYDPATGQFNPAPLMNVARWGHTTTLLGDGRVLIAGGYGGLASAELYKP